MADWKASGPTKLLAMRKIAAPVIVKVIVNLTDMLEYFGEIHTFCVRDDVKFFIDRGIAASWSAERELSTQKITSHDLL